MARWSKMSKAFTKIGREITMAIKASGSNPDNNLTLKRAIQNAKGVNMSKDNVERAIKDLERMQKITRKSFMIEYGSDGVAILIETATDNRTKTVASIRSIFNKYKGNLGTSGSLSFVFERKGVFEIETSQIELKNFEELELELIDSGAEEIEEIDRMFIITTEYEDFGKMTHTLDQLKIAVKFSGLKCFPTTTVRLAAEQAKPILKMLEKYEDADDVQNVYHNMEINHEIKEMMI